MFSTIFSVITWPTSDVVVWMMGTSPVTVTVSATVATFIVKSTVLAEEPWTGAALRTWVANPARSALTS